MKHTFSLMLLAFFAAGSASAAERKPAPYTIKSGSPIACDGTPFGRYLALGIDQEVVVARRPASNVPSMYQLSGGPLATERELIGGSGPLANAVRMASATADLDGDGDEEFVLATARIDGTFSVSTYSRGAGNALIEIDTWNYPVQGAFVGDLQVDTADVFGTQDGKLQVVVGVRDTNGTITLVGLLTGPGGTIAHPDLERRFLFTTSGGNYTGINAMRMVAGQAVAEPRDQVVLVTRRTTGSGDRIGYTILRPLSVNGEIVLTAPTGGFVEEPALAGGLSRLSVQLADTGGSAAQELVIGEQITEDGQPRDIRVRMRYFISTRDTNGALVSVALGTTTGLDYSVSSTGFNFALATGEMDRRPDAEIALVREVAGNQIRVELLDATFNIGGFPVLLGPSSPVAVATAPLAASGTARIEAVIGDANGDAVGDVYVAFREIAGGGNFTPVTKLRRFAFDPPASESAFPAPGSLALRASYDFPTGLPDASDLTIGAPDIDQDSLVARIGATCRRTTEPMVRSVVALPPYWTRLQAGSGAFNAAIGRSATNGSASELRYGTFSSHDVSGYAGVQVGGKVFGIGMEVQAKVTAGGNWERNRTELRTSEVSQTLTETQSQSGGEGLVVIEENLYDCYEYDVLRGGQPAAASNLRVCEIVRRGANGANPQTFVASDLSTWDTSTAAGTANDRPAQWFPLHPDWANIALFRPVTASIAPEAGAPSALTDGRFNTFARAPSSFTPYFNIDLGSVQDITNIRVWPQPGAPELLSMASIYASETPITGLFPPTSARRFSADGRFANGLDRWNVWTRDASTGAPLRARYLRIQTDLAARLGVAEVQVFGDVHREPPQYPVAVCDPVDGDGLFAAVVADAVASPAAWRAIDIRGDLQWVGVQPMSIHPQCPGFHGGVRRAPIWDTISVQGSGAFTWSLEDATSNLIGTSRGTSHTARVGAELDVETGVVAGVVAGAAYEFATGATEERGTSMFWGASLQYTGTVGGFSSAATACAYRPQPYSYIASDRSNVGYRHQYTVVDYIVTGLNWQQVGGSPPSAACYPAREDALFSNSFEPSPP